MTEITIQFKFNINIKYQRSMMLKKLKDTEIMRE